MLIVEPVVMAPLRREWEGVKAAADPGLTPAAKNGERKAAEKAVRAFAGRLASVRILDPACGSGNFLYVAIQCLLDLERQVVRWGAERGVKIEPAVSPVQLHGIEINEYAAELARISIWIGYLKWQRENGVADTGKRPILDKLDTIECRDAILKRGKGGQPIAQSPGWPEADFIIGNPPFLGQKFFAERGLTEEFLRALYKTHGLPKESDLCCYWFELAGAAIAKNPALRAGLLATQGIRGDDNRVVLERIIDRGGSLFVAWADRDWVLDGAAVHVSMIGFDSGQETDRRLDGRPVNRINADLTSGLDLTQAKTLPENVGVYVRSPEKGAPFEVPFDLALRMLADPNPHGRSNAEVLHPWINGEDLVGGRAYWWIIDYPGGMSAADAAKFAAPYAHVYERVFPDRAENSDPRVREQWWRFRRSGEGVRQASANLPRLLGTTMVSKHRLFAWIDSSIQPDKTIPVFARADDYFLGVLHSSIHEVWSRRVGTQLREAESGFRYTPTTCFETFPLPWPPGQEPATPKAPHHTLWKAIAAAAAELDRLRENWLNPPEWIAEVERLVYLKYRGELAAVPAAVRSLVHRSAVMAEAAKDERLKKRTLTNLYNDRPAWLRHAHAQLDRAVLAAYAAVDPAGAWDPGWAVVYEPFGAGEIEVRKPPAPGAKRGKRERSDPPEAIAAKEAAIAARAPVDERILANLLRMNHERAG